jgi:RNA polymerase sigma factor (sigma-70 family)
LIVSGKNPVSVGPLAGIIKETSVSAGEILMASRHPQLLRHIHQLAGVRADDDVSDRQLLRRFATTGEDMAFEALVRRHGMLVWAVCRRVLGEDHAAEDVFQAVFLVLARKAGVRRWRESVGPWLYEVANRLAVKARADTQRRRSLDRQVVVPPPAPEPEQEAARRELVHVVDEEVHRLPPRYQAPVVLCYLEGRTTAQAARALGWPLTTLKGRLARARDLLRVRLTRRGLALSAGGALPLGTLPTASAAIPAGLLSSTVRLTALLMVGEQGLAGGASAPVARLVEGMLHAMFVSKMKLAGVVVVVLALAGTAGLLAHQILAVKPTQEAQAERPSSSPLADPPRNRTDRYGDPLPPGAVARLGTIRARFPAGSPLILSADGQTVAVAVNGPAAKGEVLVGEAATGKVTHHFKGLGQVGALAFAPAGNLLAAAEFNLVRVWDVATGRELHQVKAEFGVPFTSSVVVAPDGKTLASGSTYKARGPTLQLWDLTTGKECWHWGDRNQPPTMSPIAFSPDGKTLVARGLDGDTVYLLDVATGQELRQLTGLKKPSTIIVPPDGSFLASASPLDAMLHLFDPTSGKDLRQVPRPRGALEKDFAFSYSGKVLAWAGRDLTRKDPAWAIHLVDLATGSELRQVAQGLQVDGGLMFLPGDRTLAFRAWGETLPRFWDLSRDRELRPTGGHHGRVSAVAFTPDGRTLISDGADGTIRFWDPATGKELSSLPMHQDSPWCMAFTPDAQTLAAATWYSGRVQTWNTVMKAEGSRLEGRNTQPACALAITPDGKTIGLGDQRPFDLQAPSYGAHLWDLATGKELGRYAAHRSQISSLAFSPDGALLATASPNDWQNGWPVGVWEVASGAPSRRFASAQVRGICVAFSPDGRTLVCAGRPTSLARPDGPITLWEVATGQERLKLRGLHDWTECLAVSPDGRLLAAGGRGDAKVRLWDLTTGKRIREWEGHRSPVHTLAFSPDGRSLASGSSDTTVLIWDVAGVSRRPAPRVKLGPADLESLWADLSGPDAVRTYRAMHALAAEPHQAVPLVKERVSPAPAVDPRVLAGYLADLNSDEFRVREKAEAELAKLGDRAEAALRSALQKGMSLEAQHRLRRLLEQWDGPVTDPGRRRELRAVEVLEWINTSEAHGVLQGLAGGAPEARLTREAQTSLKRLTKR